MLDTPRTDAATMIFTDGKNEWARVVPVELFCQLERALEVARLQSSNLAEALLAWQHPTSDNLNQRVLGAAFAKKIIIDRYEIPIDTQAQQAQNDGTTTKENGT